MNPAKQLSDSHQFAFDYFNSTLFGGTLPDCVLTLTRKAGTNGYFYPDSWLNTKGEIANEIALNPEALDNPREAMASLCRQMVSLWQHCYGKSKPKKWNYSNKEWANKMREIGLTPVGEEVGYNVEYCIDEKGNFEKAFERVPTEILSPWKVRPQCGSEERESKKKVKYNCPQCGLNTWGKSGLRLACEPCNTSLVESAK